MSSIRGNEISMIFQDATMSLNPILNIKTQMIETILAHNNINKNEAKHIALKSLKNVGIKDAENKINYYPHEFSGGMRQRVAIAIALINNPKLVIADEPTTALDVTTQAQILYLTQKLCRENNTSLIWITHDLSVLSGLVDNISVMLKGEIVESGSVNKIIDNPSHPYTRKLINSLPVDKLSAYDEKKDIVLSIKNLNKVYSERKDLITNFYSLFNKNKKNDDNKAIKNLSLDIFNGEILGIVGESGCGKSTLGKIICEILDKNSGEIFYKNKKISNFKKSNLDIQMVFQDPYSSLNPRKRILDIIGEAAHVHKIVNKGDIKKYVSELMTSCGISPNLMNRYPHEFSGGQRQRIAIARALAVKPSLLICDEIVSALDVSIQAQILELINKLNKNNKLTIVFISHDLSVVNYISDRVAVMHLGEIVELGNSDQVFLRPSHSYTKALLANLPTIKDRNINYKPTLYTEE
jgi:peptide/nickel transport system ATP-binding protein